MRYAHACAYFWSALWRKAICAWYLNCIAHGRWRVYNRKEKSKDPWLPLNLFSTCAHQQATMVGSSDWETSCMVCTVSYYISSCWRTRENLRKMILSSTSEKELFNKMMVTLLAFNIRKNATSKKVFYHHHYLSCWFTKRTHYWFWWLSFSSPSKPPAKKNKAIS